MLVFCSYCIKLLNCLLLFQAFLLIAIEIRFFIRRIKMRLKYTTSFFIALLRASHTIMIISHKQAPSMKRRANGVIKWFRSVFWTFFYNLRYWSKVIFLFEFNPANDFTGIQFLASKIESLMGTFFERAGYGVRILSYLFNFLFFIWSYLVNSVPFLLICVAARVEPDTSVNSVSILVRLGIAKLFCFCDEQRTLSP